MRMAADEKVINYVNRLKAPENKLAEIGHIVGEDEKRRALLKGLREKFSITAAVIRATEKAVNQAISELVTFEATIPSTETDGPNSGGSALTVTDVCDHCGRNDHMKENCFHNPHSTEYRRNGKGSHRVKKNMGVSRKNDARSRSAYTAFLTHCCLTSGSLPSYISSKWYVDSGASAHICNRASDFTQLDTTKIQSSVSVGNGVSVKVAGVGTVRCHEAVAGKKVNLELRDVLFIPTLMCNLLAVSKIRRAGFRIVFDTTPKGRGICSVIENPTRNTLLNAIKSTTNGLYEAVMFPERMSSATMLTSQEKSELWHQRLGHPSNSTLKHTILLVNGVSCDKSTDISACESCQKGKSKRNTRPPASQESRMSTVPLELLHTDIVGPMKSASIGGSRYFVPLYHDGSAVSLVRFIKTKSAASSAVKEMINGSETLYNCKVQRLNVRRIRSDNVTVFLSEQFQNWLKEKGIFHELSSPYSPESNGKAERLNRTLLDMARTLMMDLGDSQSNRQLWAEAVNTANYLRNRIYSSACNDIKRLRLRS